VNSSPMLQLRWLEDLAHDLRFGLRMLTRQPIALIAAMAALALGIGLVALMFCLINGTLLRGLPLPEGDRLVSTTVSAWEFRDFAEQQTSFEGLVNFGAFHSNFRAAGATSRRSVCFTTANIFDVLRVKPILGRAFHPGEDKAGAEPVALLSYNLWQEEFRGDTSVLGSIIWLDGKPQSIIGVMPPDFHFPINESVWVAAEVTAELAYRDRGFVFGRLKPSASMTSARADLNTIWTRLVPPRHADEPALEPIRVGSYTDALTGALHGKSAVKTGSVAVMLATLLVLFLACANVAMLTLGRAVKRGPEFAVRSALGATRRRLVFQMLAENLVLSVGGAIGGTFAAAWIKNWIMSQMPGDTSVYRNYASWWNFEIDSHVLLFVAGLTFLTNLAAGLWPALQATKRDVNELLKDQAPGSSGFRLAGFQRFLIVSQVAVSVVILVGAAALVAHGRRLSDVHLPFDPKAMVIANVEVPYAADTNLFFEELERSLAHVPGVEAVALSSHRFVFNHGTTPLELKGRSYARAEDRPLVAGRIISPSFFNTVNLPLLQGRSFGTDDRAGSAPVAVVNATFAQRFLPPGNPLGSRFRNAIDGRWLTVVGSVPDVLTYGVDGREPVYYVPLSQHPRQTMRVLLRGSGAALTWMKTARIELERLQPNLPPPSLGTVQQEVDGVDASKRYESLLLSVCGAASLFLATVGIWGLITLSVNQRTREIGIRLALGATRDRVVFTILKQALLQVGLGLVAGVLLALALVQSLDSVLPATATQPSVYAAVIALLGSVSLMAVLIPAVSGTKVNPMDALRHE
jgi:putative ABC transport system permease protein